MDRYIGLDAHSKTCMFVVLNAQGKELGSQRINTTETEILKFLGSIKGKKHLVFEECHLSRWLHVVIKNHVDELVVCNPRFVAKRTGPKNDYQDALHLAQQLRGNYLTPVFHDDSFFSELRTIVNAYEGLIGDLVRAKCRYKALFAARGISTAGSAFYNDAGAIDGLDRASQFVARKLIGQVNHLSGLRGDYKSYFAENVKTNSQIAALATIPCVSSVRANIIAATVVDPKRFKDKHKFWSYCMLVRHDKQSDGKSYGKVTLFANSSLKKVYMGAATQAIGKGGELRRYYDAQTAKGADARAARKNLARRIAAISLGIMKTGKPFQEREAFAIKSNLV